MWIFTSTIVATKSVLICVKAGASGENVWNSNRHWLISKTSF